MPPARPVSQKRIVSFDPANIVRTEWTLSGIEENHQKNRDFKKNFYRHLEPEIQFGCQEVL